MNSYKVVREMRHRVLSPWTFAAITLKSGKLPAIAVVPACAALLFGALSLPAFGQVAAGGLRGVTRDSASGQPVSHVRVVAHNVGKHTDLAAVSSDDGTFEI